MNSRRLYQLVHGRMPSRNAPRRRSVLSSAPARDSRHRAYVRAQACACCGSTFDVEAAHTGDDGGMRQKASDYSCIPLCTDCHTLAPYSWHRDREECERRILARLGLTVADILRELLRGHRCALDA